jgi:hypothetical protein
VKSKEALKNLAASFGRMREERDTAATLIPSAFPVGSEVYYEHGERLRRAIVVKHPHFGHLRVKVRGVTGKEYWIDVWNLLREMVEDFKR